MPPVTGFKWAIGHLFAAAGLLEVTVGLNACRRKVVPGIANLEQKAASCTGLNVSEQARASRSDIVLVLCRGFAGVNAAVLLRAIN
jgi:3-oxoacyl-[acyl-carrier-protein] synthase-1